jgi:hypothetical protein
MLWSKNTFCDDIAILFKRQLLKIVVDFLVPEAYHALFTTSGGELVFT